MGSLVHPESPRTHPPHQPHPPTSNMLAKIVALVALVAVSNAAPEKRQLPTCTNAFTLTTNPCTRGGRTYFPVPGDNQKFVQCDILGGAYVVQCPTGQLYNPTLNACQTPQIATPAPQPANPCTAAAINAGTIYFTYPGDNTKFYQCTGIGQLNVAQCPANLIWSQARVSCTLPAGTSVSVPVTQTPVQPGLNNPCTPQQIAAKNLYFAHPDPTKFIQCDLMGNAYEMVCPTNLIWNQYYEVCDSSFALNPSIGKK